MGVQGRCQLRQVSLQLPLFAGWLNGLVNLQRVCLAYVFHYLISCLQRSDFSGQQIMTRRHWSLLEGTLLAKHIGLNALPIVLHIYF